MRFALRIVAVATVFSLVAGLSGPKLVVAVTPAVPFVDIQSSPNHQAISTLWELGVVTGVETDKYDPAGSVTRAQMAALIVRAMGKVAEAKMLESVPSEFRDVPGDHWARGFVTLANRAGIIKGDGTGFHPNDPVNFAQAVTMLVRALGYEDQVVGGYPSGYVVKANELGIMTDTAFELFANVNRENAAQLLFNAVFRAETTSNGLTWSQSVFRRAYNIRLDAVPGYVAPGQTVPLTATVTDLVGKPLRDAQVQYSVTSGDGRISGSVVTIESGTVTVKAAVGDIHDSATLVAVSDLRVEPESFQATKGQSIQLTATAASGGQRVPVQPTWSVSQGPAQVNDSGMLVMTDYGSVAVQAALGTLKATSNGRTVGKVTIASQPEYLVPGLSHIFTATVADSAGAVINVPITWSATGATIDRQTGRLTNPSGNEVTVTATAAGLSGKVTIPVLKSIQVNPPRADLLKGRQLKFAAKGLDSTGKQYDITPVWDRTVASVGVINAEGAFGGTGSGTTYITATLGSLSGRAELHVSGPPTRLNANVGVSSLPASVGATTKVTVKLFDDSGSLSPVDDLPILFSVSPTSKGTLDRSVVLSKQGEASATFTAGNEAGTVSVSVTVPGTTITGQSLMVTIYQPTPAQIRLSANPQPLATGGGVATVTATLTDPNGFSVNAQQTIYVTLLASGSAHGSLAGTTITIPQGHSSGSLSFISSGLPGSVQISGTSTFPVTSMTMQTATAGTVSGVKIRPITDKTPVTGLSTLPVKVNVVDAEGVSIANDNTTQVQLTVTYPSTMQGGQTVSPAVLTATASGGVATFQVPAIAVGTATIQAALVEDLSKNDTVTAEFIPGVLSMLRLTAQPTTIAADGFTQTQLVAEVVDRTGVTVTNVNPVVTFKKLVDGNVTTPITELTVQAVGGRAVLTLQSTRATGTDTWYAIAPGLDTINIAAVTSNAASGDAYTLRVSGATSYNTGASGTLVVNVVDAQGRVVTTDTGRMITATHNIAGLTISTSAITQNGTATFVVVGNQAASGTVSLSTAGLPVPVVSAPISIGISGSPYSLFASTSLNSVRVGSSATITVRIMDSQGSILTGDNGRVVTASANGFGTLSSQQTTTVGGIATFTFNATSVGTATITVTAPGLPQPQTLLLVTVTN